MKRYRVYMTEVVSYAVVVEVDSQDDIPAAAEEVFVRGEYETYGQDDRRVVDWEEIGPRTNV